MRESLVKAVGQFRMSPGQCGFHGRRRQRSDRTWMTLEEREVQGNLPYHDNQKDGLKGKKKKGKQMAEGVQSPRVDTHMNAASLFKGLFQNMPVKARNALNNHKHTV